jgi:membrane dipeptidase
MDVSADAVRDVVDDIHSTETVFDAVAPLARDESTLGDWVRGGASVVGVTIASREGCAGAMGLLGQWHRRLAARRDTLLHVTRPEDMKKARREGKLGILFHFQGSAPLEKDLDLVETYYRLGVRVIQLTYNVRGLQRLRPRARQGDGACGYAGRPVAHRTPHDDGGDGGD